MQLEENIISESGERQSQLQILPNQNQIPNENRSSTFADVSIQNYTQNRFQNFRQINGDQTVIHEVTQTDQIAGDFQTNQTQYTENQQSNQLQNAIEEEKSNLQNEANQENGNFLQKLSQSIQQSYKTYQEYEQKLVPSAIDLILQVIFTLLLACILILRKQENQDLYKVSSTLKYYFSLEITNRISQVIFSMMMLQKYFGHNQFYTDQMIQIIRFTRRIFDVSLLVFGLVAYFGTEIQQILNQEPEVIFKMFGTTEVPKSYRFDMIRHVMLTILFTRIVIYFFSFLIFCHIFFKNSLRNQRERVYQQGDRDLEMAQFHYRTAQLPGQNPHHHLRMAVFYVRQHEQNQIRLGTINNQEDNENNEFFQKRLSELQDFISRQSTTIKLEQIKNEKCIICLEDLKVDGSEQICELKCSDQHIFHVSCLSGWVNKSDVCPICRQKITPN